MEDSHGNRNPQKIMPSAEGGQWPLCPRLQLGVWEAQAVLAAQVVLEACIFCVLHIVKGRDI